MAFTDKEKELIIWGKANGKSQPEVEQALVRLRSGIGPVAEAQSQQKSEPSYVEGLKTDLNERVDRSAAILNRKDTTSITKAGQIFGQGVGLAANAIEKTAEQIPGVKEVAGAVGSGIDALSKTAPVQAVGKVIGSTQTAQDLVKYYDSDPNFKDTVDAAVNTLRLGGDLAGALDGANLAKNVAKKSVSTVKDAASKLPTEGIKTPTIVKNVAKDIVPTADRIVNDQVTKALQLTQGDVKNINLSTGNEPGQFLAKNNLIGNNIDETVSKINDFYKSNYDAVRAEITKVKNAYTPDEVPRFKEALTALKQQISEVPGMQAPNAEVDTLLGQKTISLGDVQKVKELMDDHFSLYKATGDVKEGVAKEGLTNIRKDLREFIEKEVKKTTGADIKSLNNNVSTSRSITDAIEERSTRGLTRSNISLGDLGVFGATTSAFGGNFLAGTIALLIKKSIESPAFKLRFSKWLDGLSDTQRAKVSEQLKAGEVPPELEAIVNEVEG